MDWIRLMENAKGKDSTTRAAADEELLPKVFLAKAEHWKYEKEWRILGIRIGHSEPGVYQFPASALVAIILGCQTTPVQIEQAHDLVRHGKQKVRLNQANVSRSEFVLDIEEIR